MAMVTLIHEVGIRTKLKVFLCKKKKKEAKSISKYTNLKIITLRVQ
jgi:hypothetical protein